jgi:hypothetical protein
MTEAGISAACESSGRIARRPSCGRRVPPAVHRDVYASAVPAAARTVTRTTVDDTGISAPFFDALKNLKDETTRFVARRVWPLTGTDSQPRAGDSRVEHQRARQDLIGPATLQSHGAATSRNARGRKPATSRRQPR